MKRIGAQTLEFTAPPTVLGHGAVGGRKESEGPLAADFHQTFDDTRLQTDSWEKAEAQLQKEAVSVALAGAGLGAGEVDMIFAGDLLNQCISSTFGLLEYQIPFLGQYGACSTMAQTLLMAGIMVDCGAARRAAAVTSSHFCSAERQYRFPLAYGGQRPPTAQWTATAAGAAVLADCGGDIRVTHAVFGEMVDMGVKDANNMGSAMAPSACDTLEHLFEDTGTKPTDYDRILTGDLAAVGADLLVTLLRRDGIDVTPVYSDCGSLLYGEEQDTRAGGSGCGCSAVVLSAYVLKKIEEGIWKRVLFLPTGALLSKTSYNEGQSIPGIAHGVVLEWYKG